MCGQSNLQDPDFRVPRVGLQEAKRMPGRLDLVILQMEVEEADSGVEVLGREVERASELLLGFLAEVVASLGVREIGASHHVVRSESHELAHGLLVPGEILGLVIPLGEKLPAVIERGILLDDLSEIRDGARQVARHGVQPRLTGTQADLECAPKRLGLAGREGLLEASDLTQQLCLQVVGVDPARIELDGFVERLECLIDRVGRSQHLGQGKPRVRLPGTSLRQITRYLEGDVVLIQLSRPVEQLIPTPSRNEDR